MSQYPPHQPPPPGPYGQQPLPPSNLPPASGGYVPQHQVNEGLGSWMLTTFLLMIPLVNIIYLLVLAFGGSSSIAKANFARAMLIWTAIMIVVLTIFFILFAAAGVSIFNEISNEYSTNYSY